MFISLRLVLDQETDEGLRHTREVLKDYLIVLDTLPAQLRIMDEVVELRTIQSLTNTEVFTDTLFYDVADQEYKPYRKYTFEDKIGGQLYVISLNHSRVENEDLISTILLVNLGILALLLLALNQLNRFLSLRLWRPFYQTIEEIKHFSVQDNEKINLGQTQTDEFAQLNRSLASMTDKLQRDYQSLRRFTENASHELQTPLTIMRHQVDLLLQNAKRPAADFESISHLSEAISRLGRLNKALLLLTRIENKQYKTAETINLLGTLKQKIAALRPLLKDRQLELSEDLSDCRLEINAVLADVLLNNLLENAIKYNEANGKIQLFLNSEKLKLSNTGPATSGPTEELFERFTKGKTDNQSLGLGLAIVREICTLYGWSVQYHNPQNWHEVIIVFAPPSV